MLVETWVPEPRLVVVGTGDLVSALEAQAALLGWQTRATQSLDELDGLLAWAGATAALIVLSHDPHIDSPALATALAGDVPYVGAMGSRATQSRRARAPAGVRCDPGGDRPDPPPHRVGPRRPASIRGGAGHRG